MPQFYVTEIISQWWLFVCVFYIYIYTSLYCTVIPSFASITNKNSAHFIANNFTSKNLRIFYCKSAPLATCIRTYNGVYTDQTGRLLDATACGRGDETEGLWKTGRLGIWELLEKATWNRNRRWHTSIGWIAVTCFTNSCAGCNSWQLLYHSGTTLPAVTVMWTSAAGCITLMLFATRQDRQCASDVILRNVRANIVGFAVLGKYLKSGAFVWIWENPLFMWNAATLVARGNISLTINIALSEEVTEFSAVVRIQ